MIGNKDEFPDGSFVKWLCNGQRLKGSNIERYAIAKKWGTWGENLPYYRITHCRDPEWDNRVRIYVRSEPGIEELMREVSDSRTDRSAICCTDRIPVEVRPTLEIELNEGDIPEGGAYIGLVGDCLYVPVLGRDTDTNKPTVYRTPSEANTRALFAKSCEINTIRHLIEKYGVELGAQGDIDQWYMKRPLLTAVLKVTRSDLRRIKGSLLMAQLKEHQTR